LVAACCFAVVFASGSSGRQTTATNAERIAHVSQYETGNFAGAWSPDGRRIAFESDRRGTWVYVMNADGSAKRRLARGYAPAWSPDGRTIAFTRSDPRGNGLLYLMNADGTDQRLLARTSTDNPRPVWSPDGLQVAFSDTDRGWAYVYVVSAEGTHPKRLNHTRGSDLDVSPAWSPDGRRIAFMSTSGSTDQTGQIYVMSADGTKPRQLTHPPAGDGYYPAWSPDGRTIAFTKDLSDNNYIYLMNTDGSNQRRLTHKNSENEEEAAWSPDGRKLIYTGCSANPRTNIAPCDVYVVDNDGTHRKRLTSP
jgi:TolB protein